MAEMQLEGERVTLRAATAADIPVMLDILTAPGVAPWWPGVTIEECDEMIVDPEVHAFVVEHRGNPVGFIQFVEEPEADYRHASIDVALHDRWHGKGLGTDAVRTLARHLVRDRGHHRVTIDPAASNARAIRCYEKVGFQAVGVMRQYERGGDGTWHDGLLMDLLADDITT
jgi:aminoglycoside 6'-N-acetyltransferase